MRELKFRAYHKYMEKMLIPIKLHLNNGKITCFETLLDDNVYQVKIDDKEYGLHIMQYTGLKDKNGKEIYEGDIVKNKQAGSILEERPIGEIIWEDNGMWIRDRGGKGDYKHSFESIHDSEILDKYGYPDDIYSSLWLEVIGNIYEDNHLLTN